MPPYKHGCAHLEDIIQFFWDLSLVQSTAQDDSRPHWPKSFQPMLTHFESWHEHISGSRLLSLPFPDSEWTDLTFLLRRFRSWECADPRDHIYGLASLFDQDNLRKPLTVSYSIPVLDLAKHALAVGSLHDTLDTVVALCEALRLLPIARRSSRPFDHVSMPLRALAHARLEDSVLRRATLSRSHMPQMRTDSMGSVDQQENTNDTLALVSLASHFTSTEVRTVCRKGNTSYCGIRLRSLITSVCPYGDTCEHYSHTDLIANFLLPTLPGDLLLELDGRNMRRGWLFVRQKAEALNIIGYGFSAGEDAMPEDQMKLEVDAHGDDDRWDPRINAECPKLYVDPTDLLAMTWLYWKKIKTTTRSRSSLAVQRYDGAADLDGEMLMTAGDER